MFGTRTQVGSRMINAGPRPPPTAIGLSGRTRTSARPGGNPTDDCVHCGATDRFFPPSSDGVRRLESPRSTGFNLLIGAEKFGSMVRVADRRKRWRTARLEAAPTAIAPSRPRLPRVRNRALRRFPPVPFCLTLPRLATGFSCTIAETRGIKQIKKIPIKALEKFRTRRKAATVFLRGLQSKELLNPAPAKALQPQPAQASQPRSDLLARPVVGRTLHRIRMGAA